jgi:serine/threonine protein kinase
MEYYPVGDFYSFLSKNKLEVAQVKSCFIQIIHALKAVHNLGYVYRDLKP